MSLWSAHQHEWLEAMGLEVVQLASAQLTEPAAAHPAQATVAAASPPSASTAPRLERALLQALRSRPDPAVDLAALGVDVDALRGDGRAKRALWVRLRAVRASAR